MNLDAIERGMRHTSQTDLTEAKEAIVEAVVQLSLQRCTGEGVDGDFIFGAKPSAKLVSGFLLPRFDASGQEDETSDIHIAIMGIDLQVGSDQSGEVVVTPNFSIYVRVLPTWEDISSPCHDIMPRSELSRETRQHVELRARQYISEAIAGLPPLEDPVEPDERPAAAIAEAQRAREIADQTEQRLVEEGELDSEAKGSNRAAQLSAQHAEQVSAARTETVRQRVAARRERNAAVAAIRKEAFSRAFADLGIRLNDARGAAVARALQSDDLTNELEIEKSQPERTDADVPDTAADEPPIADEVAASVEIVVRPEVGVLDDAVAERQPIPMKWRRFRLALGEYRFDCHDEAARVTAMDAFAARVLQQTRTMLTDWLATEEGQRDAYRPNERILPSHFSSKSGWDRYLSDLRQRRSAVVQDILPDLSGVALVLNADPDFVDATRVNFRAAIENGADQPSRQTLNDYEPSLFQVELGVTLPSVLHRPLRLDRVQPSYRFKDWLTYPAMGLNCGVQLAVLGHALPRSRRPGHRAMRSRVLIQPRLTGFQPAMPISPIPPSIRHVFCTYRIVTTGG